MGNPTQQIHGRDRATKHTSMNAPWSVYRLRAELHKYTYSTSMYVSCIIHCTIQQNLCQCLQAGVEKRELLKWGHNDMSRHFRKCLHSTKTLVQILLLFYAIYCAWKIIDTITRILWFSMPQCCNIHSFSFRCHPSSSAVGNSKLCILLQSTGLTLHCYIKARTYMRSHKLAQSITV